MIQCGSTEGLAMPTVTNPDALPDEDLVIKLEDPPPTPPEGSATTAPAPQRTGTATTPPVSMDDFKRQLDEAKAQRDYAAEVARRTQQERDYAIAVATEAQQRGISRD